VDYQFASCHKGPGFKSPGGYLRETGILLLALSCYIGDPDMINHHCSLVCSRLRPKLSLGPHGWQCENPTWSHTAFLSRFHARRRSSFQLHNRRSRLLGGALWIACNLTLFSPYLTAPVDYPFASRHKGPRFKSPGGVLKWNWDSPVSVVLLQYNLFFITFQVEVSSIEYQNFNYIFIIL
jgi:hypothetical protein